MAKPILPDALWETVVPLLSPERPKLKGGCPRLPDRAVQTGILQERRRRYPDKVHADKGYDSATCAPFSGARASNRESPAAAVRPTKS